MTGRLAYPSTVMHTQQLRAYGAWVGVNPVVTPLFLSILKDFVPIAVPEYAGTLMDQSQDRLFITPRSCGQRRLHDRCAGSI